MYSVLFIDEIDVIITLLSWDTGLSYPAFNLAFDFTLSDSTLQDHLCFIFLKPALMGEDIKRDQEQQFFLKDLVKRVLLCLHHQDLK